MILARVPRDLYTGARLFQPDSNSIAARLIRRIKGYVFKGGAFRKDVYCEPHFHFDPAFFKLSGVEILLNGYFQSPRYFESVAQLLRERFQLALQAIYARYGEHLYGEYGFRDAFNPSVVY